MKNVRTFTDVEWSLGLSFAWDFETNPYNDEANNNYWDLDLDGIINNGYPYLAWEDGADVSLPVVLVDFTAEQGRDGVVLRWTTESELENLGFIICRKCKVSPTGVPEGKSSKWEEIASYLTDAGLQGQGSTSERYNYQFIDFAVQPGMTYEYRLGDVDFGGKLTWCAGAEIRIKIEDVPVATEFGLQKAFPNPFNASVTLCYNLSEDGETSLAVYNLRGQLVGTLINAYKTKGTYQTNWQPRQLSTGIYIVRLQSGARTTYRKIEYVK